MEKQWKVLLVQNNPDEARVVKEMLTKADDPFHIQTADTLVRALSMFAQDRFDAALVDLSLPDSQGLETLMTIRRHAPDLPVVVLTKLESESMALAAVEHGAQDYLVQGRMSAGPLSRVLLYAIAREARAGEAVAAQDQRANIVGVMGAKGGVGSTTFACLYAQELKRQTAESLLLVDLDSSAASAAFLMKTRSKYTALDVSTDLHRLDEGLWRGVVVAAPNGVDLLQAPGVARFGAVLDAERMRHVLRFARGLYRWIVIDLGAPDALALSLLEEAGELFLITTPEMPALFEVGRLLRRLVELGRQRDSVHLVCNRQPKSAPFLEDGPEKAMGHAVYVSLGDFTEELRDAHCSGKFLEECPQLRKQITQVVNRRLGRESGESAKPGLMRLLGFARA